MLSERNLDAADDDLFVLGGDLARDAASAAEVALVVVEHQFDVAVEIPICSHPPRSNFVSRRSSCKERRGEQLLIKRQLSVSRSQFQGAPAMLGEIEGLRRLNRVIGIRFACHKP